VKARTDRGVVFVKTGAVDPQMFPREAEGLAWLDAAGAVRIPAVLEVDATRLVLEWIEPGRPGPDHDEVLGRGLAALHRSGAPSFGAATPNWVGRLPQDNTPADTWAAFYGARRIEPLVRRAVDGGLLPPAAVADTAALLGRLDDLTGPPEPPARLHGDLWAGNALTGTDGRPVLIDPAAHGGHREVDLAMMRLFGGFGPRVFAAYHEAHPLAPGHGDRVDLYQLYPLLVHTVLFRGGYARRALAALRRYT
jgi:fructosamine-3-kinase